MKKKVLYVEDNPQNVLLMRRILEAVQVDLVSAHNGETGWEVATTTLPDLILMDLRLAGVISGFELTRRLRLHEDLRLTPILAVSAYSNENAIAAALAAGCDDFLAKPVEVQQVIQAMQHYLMPATPQQSEAVMLSAAILARN